jgi:hypothetical protein
MKCDIIFDHQSLIQLFGKTFVLNDFRKRQKKMYLENELAKMPETQYSHKFILINLRSKIKTLKQKIEEIRERYTDINPCKNSVSLLKNKEYINIQYDLYKMEQEYFNIKSMNTNAIKDKPSHKIIMKCEKDNCKGFVNETYSCNVCDTSYCNKCLINITSCKDTTCEENQHECDKDDIETAKILINNTHPCPSCGTRISKIDGCDQMWCTQCHTSFSWSTGVIETGNIHNPHYFEWLRINGNEIPQRNQLEHQCNDELIYFNNIRHFIYKYDDLIGSGKIFDYKCILSSIYHDDMINLYNIYPPDILRDIENIELITESKKLISYFKLKEAEYSTSENFNTLMGYITQLETTIQENIIILKELYNTYYCDVVIDENNNTIYIPKKDVKTSIIPTLRIKINDRIKLIYDVLDNIRNTIINYIYKPLNRLYIKIQNNHKLLETQFHSLSKYYEKIAHVIYADMSDMKKSINNSEDDTFMFNKRVEYLMGKINDKQLSESASRMKYKLDKNKKTLQLYEIIEMVGIEGFNTMYYDINKQYRNTFNFSLDDDLNNKFNILDFAFCHKNSDDYISATSNIIQMLNTHFERIMEINENNIIKFSNLFNYFNEQHDKISNEYNCKKIHLHINF